MSRDAWKQIPQTEWTRRLAAAQAQALSYLANHGLDINASHGAAEAGIAGLVLESDTGAGALWPALQDAQRIVEASLDSLTQRDGGREFNGVRDEPLSQDVFDLSMAAVEAGFLFGVIVGSNVSPAVVAAMPAPYAPPVVKPLRPARASGKGRAR